MLLEKTVGENINSDRTAARMTRVGSLLKEKETRGKWEKHKGVNPVSSRGRYSSFSHFPLFPFFLLLHRLHSAEVLGVSTGS